MPHSSLHALLRTSSQLRSQVHACITSIQFRNAAHTQLLVSGDWPSLTTVILVGHPLHILSRVSILANDMQHLCQNSWRHLLKLDLECVQLDLECLQLLVQGNWPALEQLNLRGTNLFGFRMETLVSGIWPNLKSLNLQQCNLSSQSIVHLTIGSWAKLHSLNISWNPLTAADIGKLSIRFGSQLQEVDLQRVFHNRVRTIHNGGYEVVPAGNRTREQLDPAFMHQLNGGLWSRLEVLKLQGNCLNFDNLELLAQGHWPSLKTLMLGDNKLSAESCAALCQANWPLLDTLELRNTSLCSAGMSHLVSADWPLLMSLELSYQTLTVEFCSCLATGHWPLLKRLCLLGAALSTGCVKEIVQGKWQHLQVLDLTCHYLTCEDIQHLFSCGWHELECVQVSSQPFMIPSPVCSPSAPILSDEGHVTVDKYVVADSRPDLGARLVLGENFIDDPANFAGGKFPRLQMLMLCKASCVVDPSWFYDWGHIDPRSPRYPPCNS